VAVTAVNEYATGMHQEDSGTEREQSEAKGM